MFTLTGSAATSPATLTRGTPLAFFVPSLSPSSEVRVQFALSSGGAVDGAPFGDLQRYDGSGLPFSVGSGAGPFVGYFFGEPPSPWLRLSFTAGQTAVRSCVVSELNPIR
jgi:hypothetical protein